MSKELWINAGITFVAVCGAIIFTNKVLMPMFEKK